MRCIQVRGRSNVIQALLVAVADAQAELTEYQLKTRTVLLMSFRAHGFLVDLAGLRLRSLPHFNALRASLVLRLLGRTVAESCGPLQARRAKALRAVAFAVVCSGFEAFIFYWQSSLALLLLFTPSAVGV